MKLVNKINNFATSITRINNSTRDKGISISRLFGIIDRRSNYIISLLSFLLVLMPIPTPPGFSIIFAIPSIFITMQLCCGVKEIYIPKKILNITISKNVIRKIDSSTKKYLYFINRITKQRLSFIMSENTRQIYNIILFVFALMSAVPIPFICMLPALAGALLSISLIIKDGFLTIISFIIGIISSILIWTTIKVVVNIKDYLVF